MAAGSHLEKGIWALFVIAARIISIYTMCVSWSALMELKDHRLWFKDRAINTRINESPIRFDRAVNMPPARAVGD